MAPEWRHVPSSTARLPTPTKSSQCSLAPAGEPWPKVLAAAFSSQSHSQYQARPGRERPDPVRYPCHWITKEISQPRNPHPHWWKEIKASGMLNVGACIVHKEYDDYSAQHYTLWQVAAFRLPLAQQEASSWWDLLPALHRLCPLDFIPPASDSWNFQIIQQEKTLAPARALQACAEASGAKWGVQCRVIREFQQCMALLMTINRDDVMEASLLRPLEEESGPSTTLEEETAFLGEKDGLSGSPRPCSPTSRNPQVCRTYQADYHSSHSHCTPLSLAWEERSHG